MATFKARLITPHGELTRLSNTYIVSIINGWNSGIRVETRHNNVTDKNLFRVFKTGGSNHHEEQTLLTEFEGE